MVQAGVSREMMSEAGSGGELLGAAGDDDGGTRGPRILAVGARMPGPRGTPCVGSMRSSRRRLLLTDDAHCPTAVHVQLSTQHTQCLIPL